MHVKTISTLLATAAVAVNAQIGERGNATVVTDNPAGVVYTATLPETAFFKGDAYAKGGNVVGSISATANPDGVGVIFKVKFSNIPKEGGPFKYHLHSTPVPEDGNCTLTLAHLDPFIRGETPACNSSEPQTCEVGDLSGKHGLIESDPFEVSFVDKYASTKEGIGAFFGNRSMVFHYNNKTRISCANFKRVEGSTGGGDDGGDCTTTTSTGYSTSTSTSAAGVTTGPKGTGGVVTVPKPSSTYVTVSGAGAAPHAVMALGAATMLAAIAFML